MKYSTPSRSLGDQVPFESGMRLHIDALIQERDALEEEVRQLRAAVQIYTEIARRLIDQSKHPAGAKAYC